MTKPVWFAGDADSKHGYWQEDAPQEAIDYILKQPLEASPSFTDGRSRWVWIRLPNGELVLALYPQGDTYFSTEKWRTI